MDVANALHQASDHLPVCADFVFGNISAVNEILSSPLTYQLFQNYPNPFAVKGVRLPEQGSTYGGNPNTSIEYTLKKPGMVSLRIFNSKGQLVRTLVKEYQNTGFHTIRFNGLDDKNQFLSSGIYLYRLQVNDFVKTEKMILIQ